MSFYTALTGLNGSQADISATSNNIANVATTGYKRSKAEFGDIFATSPLQNSSSSIGSGTILKGIKQQFTQGNVSSSLNALDMAISGQGFFALKPSLTTNQTVTQETVLFQLITIDTLLTLLYSLFLPYQFLTMDLFRAEK